MLHVVKAQHPNHWATREVLIMFYSCCWISFFCLLLFTLLPSLFSPLLPHSFCLLCLISSVTLRLHFQCCSLGYQ